MSHELRNPLAAIKSCSIQREFEYKLLGESLIKEANNMTGSEVRNVVIPVLDKLKHCNEVQQAS